MKLSDFKIGCAFTMGGQRWRCTDVGTRVVVAIMLDDRKDQSWFSGPSYAVPEHVIDRHDHPACEPVTRDAGPSSALARLA